MSRAGALWSAGRYEEVAAHLAPLTEVVPASVERSAKSLEGTRLLDVGCGTGSVAIEAATRGARVTALDPAERLPPVAGQSVSHEQAIARAASTVVVPTVSDQWRPRQVQAAWVQVAQVQLAQAQLEQLSEQSAQEHTAWLQVMHVQSLQLQAAHVSEHEAHEHVAHSS